MEGTIIRVNSNYCFIADDSGGDPDIFTHRSYFTNPPASFGDLPGTRVEFSIVHVPRGREARDVKILEGDKGREHGRVARLNTDFGFIESDRPGEPDIFFHSSEIVGGWIPERGLRVAYTPGRDVRNNKPRALAVRVET
jgi:cold shock CspA family protein